MVVVVVEFVVGAVAGVVVEEVVSDLVAFDVVFVVAVKMIAGLLLLVQSVVVDSEFVLNSYPEY